jgi:hypothetical protein
MARLEEYTNISEEILNYSKQRKKLFPLRSAFVGLSISG